MDKIHIEPTAKRSRGLERAFEILDYLRVSRAPANPNEIAARIKAPRSTVYELVNLLLSNGVLEYCDDEGRVYLGRKLYFLGAAYEDHFNFIRECDRALSKVAEQTRETAQFCMLDENKYTVVRMHEGARPFRISSDVGQRVPIPWTASGRLLLSHLNDAEILAFIPPEDFQLPNGQWLAPEVFLREVHAARAARAFTFDSIVDSFTHCFAVPVENDHGKFCATVCLVAPRDDGIRNHDMYLQSLREAALSLKGKVSAFQRDQSV
ncbi:IclR family transcriptional regulator [Brucella sp. 6810]|uniref:IclR family transcriptional regulator n=1 Tax=Brucella inopinata TaxID=1218315 RepID=A0AAW7B6L2_9HYPH|nr:MULTISPECIES: IclR family transcriptional regulator [Brucella]KEY05981.1 IclR family transcriptional regulator [Brucella suis bv. 4 str. 40]EFM55314.1 IclR family transcriptional regulator [Brucella inopinata BO1]MDL2332683.1 IclR family transcriptional regulator [Brucella inopinata]QGA57980.1 helix-turn-helix domain-containing protein [Brucella sp. 2280]QNQ63716.1 IclR family transcriptional regulator [Brucella sp. 6810]